MKHERETRQGKQQKAFKKKNGTRESFLPFVWEEGEDRSSKVTLWAMHTYCLSKSWSWTEAGNGFNPPSNLSPVSTARESFLCQIVNSSKHPNSFFFFFFSYGTWHSQTKPLKITVFFLFVCSNIFWISLENDIPTPAMTQGFKKPLRDSVLQKQTLFLMGLTHYLHSSGPESCRQLLNTGDTGWHLPDENFP